MVADMICKVCNNVAQKVFFSHVLQRHAVDYFFCSHCSFLQTSAPTWLDEAYQNSINLSDTGIMQRNIYFSEVTAILLFFLFERDARFVDFAGGYGIFTRLMRDFGFDFYWNDPFTKNILARGFEYKSDDFAKIDLITCFESFEHFENPIKEIERLTALSKNILFSTAILPDPLPAPCEWWYYGLDHGQHIAFYRTATLKFIADKLGLNFATDGKSLHIYSQKKISPSFFKLLVNLRRFAMHRYVRLRVKSRIESDRKQLISMQK